MVIVRDPEPGDVEKIAVVMRDVDVAECRAAGHTPWQGLFEAKRQSALVWTVEVDGQAEAMFGVVPGNVVTGIGYPWLLGSEKTRRCVRDFARLAPEYIARMESLFPRSQGMISARNTVAMRWLIRLGFQIETHYTILMHGEPMHRFSKGPADV